WYANAPNQTVLQTAAQRYEVGVTGKGDGGDAQRASMKALNPSFRWFVYNSGTDNYVTSSSGTPEHDLLVSLAASRGWDVEEAYMHYWDDTQVTLEGATILIRGWGGGSASTPAEARIPVYYRNLSRRAVNFSTPRAAQLNREVMVRLAFATPFSGSSVYPDGIFLDNSTAQFFAYGIILSGGHVREATGHPVMGSQAFLDWHWNVNYGPFLTTLKDTMQVGANWTPDHQRKYLMLNVANIWSDGYVTRDAADVLFMEFQYNPVRSFGTGMVDEAYRRDALASSAGISCFYSATMTNSVSGHVGQYSYAETMLGNLAWYLVTRTPGTLFYEMGTSVPSAAGWDSLTWRGCLDVANRELGAAVGAPYTLASGTDPLGNAYVVKARDYERGLAVLRNRGDWDEGIETGTAVSVNLPRSLSPVSPAGNTGSFVSSVTLRNGQGMLFLDHAVAVELESFEVERLGTGGAALHWVVREASADHQGFHVYRGDAGGPRQRLTGELLHGLREYTYVDATAPESGAYYWLAETAESGAVQWYGPVELRGLPVAGVWLSGGEPSPFREETTIRFGLESGGRAELRVYDVRGREVQRLYAGTGDGRSHAVTWRGEDQSGRQVSPGVYFYRLETPVRVLTRKILRAE
ncbi:MAG TPA: T9SS type A sorting domain-containing protein, partial [Candidatus Krumholzibacteria bacterium]|nr:T9SS type A sorting domain-containing protein [Candidatus Krumholzibacteria bacterium]